MEPPRVREPNVLPSGTCGSSPGQRLHGRDSDLPQSGMDGYLSHHSRRSGYAAMKRTEPARPEVSSIYRWLPLGSYRSPLPPAETSRLMSLTSILFDSPANNVGPWPASLGGTTNSYSSSIQLRQRQRKLHAPRQSLRLPLSSERPSPDPATSPRSIDPVRVLVQRTLCASIIRRRVPPMRSRSLSAGPKRCLIIS